ncbi:hypothetical protein ACE939_00640 [Aquimarina sp. W85]|uniref:hypothetical protein n=1 Tax=Aquimarina rhodophyticola TaxID=3342246 RepID=UPI00366BFB66
MGKQQLIKRLKSYYPLERFHAFVTFPVILLYILYNNAVADVVFLLYGLGIIIFVLIQGQHYWKLKLYRLLKKPFDQQYNIDLFKKAKTINGYLIALIPLILLVQLYINAWTIVSENLMNWAICANVFGVLEHINYYHRQLMIDNRADVDYLMTNKKLKVASLAKDLNENHF